MTLSARTQTSTQKSVSATPVASGFTPPQSHRQHGHVRPGLLAGVLAIAGLVVAIPALSGLQGNTDSSNAPGGNSSTRSVAIGDLNGDTFLDLAVANENGETNQVFFGNGSGGFGSGNDIDGSTDDSDSIDLADVDGDTDLDIIVGNRGSAAHPNRLYINDGNGNFSYLSQNAISTVSPGRSTGEARFGDLNGDGDPDVVVANRNQQNQVFLGGASAGFPAFFNLDASGSTDSSSVAIGNLNGDTAPDVIIGNRQNARNDLYINDGDGNPSNPFGARRDLGPDRNYTDWVEITDLNNDGWGDVVIGNKQQPNLFMLNNQSDNNNNLFYPSRRVSNDSDYTRELRAADVDGDGDMDLIAANDSFGRNKVYLNLFIETGLPAGSPDVSFSDGIMFTGDVNESTSIAIADIDGDGDLDVIIGNNGSPNRIHSNENEDPVIVSEPVLGATVGDLYEYTIIATDPDFGDTLTISAATAPAWLNTITPDPTDARRATVSGTPAGGDVGNHNVSVTVTDGSIPVSQPFTISVAAANAAPAFTSAAPPASFAQGPAAFDHELTATDAEDAASALVFSIPVAPDWMTITNNGNGTATLGGGPNQNDLGTYDLIVRVTDTGGRIDEQVGTITVTDGNDQPVAGDDLICLANATDPVTTLSADEPYYGVNNLFWNDYDPDGNTLTFTGSITGSPSGTPAVNPDGTFTYTPDGVNTTDFFRYQISDGNSAFDRGDVRVRPNSDPLCTVGPDVTPPEITVDPIAVTIQVGDTWDDAAARDGVTALDNVDGNITANIVVGGDTVDVNTPATYNVTYDVSDAAANAATQQTRTVTVEDPDMPPVITVDPLTLNIAVGGAYDELLGVSATDDIDDDAAVTANIVVGGDTVDVNTVGSYMVTYDVTDSGGNAAVQVTRTVNVETNPDTEAPVISVTPATVAIVLGDTWDDAAARDGVTATDNVDDDAALTAAIVIGGDTVDPDTLGAYQVTYNVSDSSGNAATEVTRTVNVTDGSDTTPPVITLTGSNPINLTVGSTYNEPGASATDDVDGDISDDIVVAGTVNTSAAGTYTVTYNVSDSSGNAAAEVTRTVNVTAAPPPPSSGGGGGATSIPELLGLMLLFMVVMSGRRLRLHRRST